MSDLSEKSLTYGFGIWTHLSLNGYKQVSAYDFTVNFEK